MKKLIAAAVALFALTWASSAMAFQPPGNCGDLGNGYIRDGVVSCANLLKVNSDGSINVLGSITASFSGFTPTSATSNATLAVTTSSASVALPTGLTQIVKNTGANTAFITFSTGAGTATTAGFALLPGEEVAFAVNGPTFLNAITSTSTAALNIAGGAGQPALAIAGAGGGGGGNVNLTGINSTAPSITNPLFVANAEAADVTGTFTNATQTSSITNSAADGYAAGLISINGTYGTATGVFEVSDDGGTTWYSVICGRSDGAASETGYTSLTNTNRQWSCPVGGNDSLRIRSTAVASGTINARVGISAPPPSSNTTFGTVTANAGTGTFTVNEAQINGITPLMGNGVTGTGSQRVTIASDNTAFSVNVGTSGLPTGASTSALQTTGNTSLSTIATNTTNAATTTLQTTSNTSLASIVTNTNGLTVAQGSTTSGQTGQLEQCAALTSSPTYTTGQTSPLNCDTSGNLRVVVSGGGSNGFVAQGSTTSGQVGPLVQCAATTSPPAYTTAQTNAINCDTAGNLRVNVVTGATSGAVAQGSTTSGQTGGLQQAAVTTAAPGYIAGTTNPFSLNTAGGLRVDGSGSTQPVSGTVTANAGTGTFTVSGTVTANAGSGTLAVSAASLPLPSGAATSANQPTNATLGSTTSGQTGGLALGAVTTAAPSYTTTQSNALSLTTAGALRTDSSAVTQPVSQATAANLLATVTQGPGATANPWTVQGAVAQGVTSSGNPVPFAGTAVTSPTAVTAGQRHEINTDLNGNLETQVALRGTTGADGLANSSGIGLAVNAGALTTNVLPAIGAYGFNATSWDRIREDITGTNTAGASGGLYTQDRSRSFRFADTTTTLTSGSAFTGTARDTTVAASTWAPQGYFNAFFLADQASAASGALIQCSNDNFTTTYTCASGTLTASTPLILQVPITFEYYRVKLTNGGTNQGSVVITSSYTAS